MLVLNLHLLSWDSYIAKRLSSPHSQACLDQRIGREGKNLVAVTHLARARSQKTRRGISGVKKVSGDEADAIQKRKKQLSGDRRLLFLICIFLGIERNTKKAMSGVVKKDATKKRRILRKGFLCAAILLLFFWHVVISILSGDKPGDGRERDAGNEGRKLLKGEKTERNMPYEIRVLIRTSGYEDLYHECLEMQGDTEIIFDDGREERRVPKGEVIRLQKGDEVFKGGETIVRIYPEAGNGRVSVLNVLRSQGIASYQGRLEIREVEEGLLLLNVLPLEHYLCGVLPSEMPSTFPEEALKAQAICARTYAYGKLRSMGYPELGADLDDSTAFQVYGNLSEQKSCMDAVKATSGLVLVDEKGNLMETFYYSTSCGRGTDVTAWQSDAPTGSLTSGGIRISRSAMRAMLQGSDHGRKEKTEVIDRDEMRKEADFLLVEEADDFEAELPWYRWTYQVERLKVDEMAKRISRVLDLQEDLAIHDISAMSITRRGPGGVALELKMITDQGEYVILGEHGIREVLCDGETPVIRRDGTKSACPSLLPSAFFLMETSAMGENVIGYSLIGGGLGHGIGMSQSAAGVMAREGHDAEEILAFFYEGGRLHDIR